MQRTHDNSASLQLLRLSLLLLREALAKLQGGVCKWTKMHAFKDERGHMWSCMHTEASCVQGHAETDTCKEVDTNAMHMWGRCWSSATVPQHCPSSMNLLLGSMVACVACTYGDTGIGAMHVCMMHACACGNRPAVLSQMTYARTALLSKYYHSAPLLLSRTTAHGSDEKCNRKAGT
eukprot:1137720-Pelagomonas_calceolata.AAC.5